MVYKDCGIKRGPFCYVYLLMEGGGAFSLLKAFLLLFSPCGGIFAMVFSLWGSFFHNLQAFFSHFFHVGAFLLRLSPYGGIFHRLKPFCYFFLDMGAFLLCFSPYGFFFHDLKALLLRFSPFREPFSPVKGLSATFFLYVEAFLIRFSFHGGLFFHHLKAFLLLFFSMWGCCVVFVFMGTIFWIAPPPTKISAGAHACVSLNPYE